MGRQGVESLMGGVPPKSAPDLKYIAFLSDVSTLLVEWNGKMLFRWPLGAICEFVSGSIILTTGLSSYLGN